MTKAENRPGESDYLVTVTFRARAQSAEQAVNETRDTLDAATLGRFEGMWIIHEAHRIKTLNGGD